MMHWNKKNVLYSIELDRRRSELSHCLLLELRLTPALVISAITVNTVGIIPSLWEQRRLHIVSKLTRGRDCQTEVVKGRPLV